ncbi:MAG: GAF domain-containing protein [Clostridia bacterium]|nr:GAF domain-containing protein [Clostridia bacterium]
MDEIKFGNRPDPEVLEALVGKSPSLVSALSNAAAYLFGCLEKVNWAGFYILRGEQLVLGPFQGKPACDLIPLSSGLCGRAAREKRVVRVADVHACPEHIACDESSRSEIVLPIRAGCGDALWGLLDIDSPVTDRFTQEDEELLVKAAEVMERAVNSLGPLLLG